MVTEKFAKDQILRLSRLRNFPSGMDEAPLRADLVAELRECPSDDRAKAIVDDWLAESGDAPTIAQLRAVVRAKSEQKPFGCRACDGTGFRLWRDALGRDCASPCNCRKRAVA